MLTVKNKNISLQIFTKIGTLNDKKRTKNYHINVLTWNYNKNGVKLQLWKIVTNQQMTTYKSSLLSPLVPWPIRSKTYGQDTSYKNYSTVQKEETRIAAIYVLLKTLASARRLALQGGTIDQYRYQCFILEIWVF